MKHSTKPIAFVAEGSTFIVPNPTFSEESQRHLRGRFIYTREELERAKADMARAMDERRALADYEYGADAVTAPADYTDIEDVKEHLAGVRETVPSMTASPKRQRKTGGESKKLTQPNIQPLPESLHEEPRGMNLTPEEAEDYVGIDTGNAVTALFGAGR